MPIITLFFKNSNNPGGIYWYYHLAVKQVHQYPGFRNHEMKWVGCKIFCGFCRQIFPKFGSTWPVDPLAIMCTAKRFSSRSRRQLVEPLIYIWKGRVLIKLRDEWLIVKSTQDCLISQSDQPCEPNCWWGRQWLQQNLSKRKIVFVGFKQLATWQKWFVGGKSIWSWWSYYTDLG
jgi:hypothetical protein